MNWKWIGSVDAEAGGPLLITDLAGAKVWQGEEGHSQATGEWFLRWLGPWSSRLSAAFPKGGRLRVSSAAEAQRLSGQWRKELEMLEPKLQAATPAVGKGISLYLEQGQSMKPGDSKLAKEALPEKKEFLERAQRLLSRQYVCTLEVGPVNDFIEAYTALGENHELAKIEFAGQSGLVWSIEGPGSISVAVRSKGSEILFLKCLFGDEDTEDKVKEWISQEAVQEEPSGEMVLGSPTAAALWSPRNSRNCKHVQNCGARLSKPIEILDGCGILFPTRPGCYKASYGRHETREWAARWCRLKQISS